MAYKIVTLKVYENKTFDLPGLVHVINAERRVETKTENNQYYYKLEVILEVEDKVKQ